ncbi:MAG: HNH endonuclease [Opitutus sp.]|nr:HNH endonuclease [Opitutus sp.]
MASEVSERLRQQVAERAYHVCEYCLLHEDDTFWGCQVDHIISRKHKGSTEFTNLAFERTLAPCLPVSRRATVTLHC